MASSSKPSSTSSNREIDLAHIGAWCSLPPLDEHYTSLQLSNASIKSPSYTSACFSDSVNNTNPELKRSAIGFEAGMQLAHAVILRESILESRHVNSQQVSNHWAVRPSGHIEGNEVHYISKSEYSLDGYDYGYPAHSPVVQKWLGEGHEEGSFVPIEGTQEVVGTKYEHASTMDSKLQPTINSEKKVNHS
jgi:hypothetical protein